MNNIVYLGYEEYGSPKHVPTICWFTKALVASIINKNEEEDNDEVTNNNSNIISENSTNNGTINRQVNFDEFKL